MLQLTEMNASLLCPCFPEFDCVSNEICICLFWVFLEGGDFVVGGSVTSQVGLDDVEKKHINKIKIILININIYQKN